MGSINECILWLKSSKQLALIIKSSNLVNVLLVLYIELDHLSFFGKIFNGLVKNNVIVSLMVS